MKPPTFISWFVGIALATTLFFVSSCQNSVIEEPEVVVPSESKAESKTESKTKEEPYNVCLAIIGYEDARFGTNTKADAGGLADVCKRVDAQVFDTDGKRVVKKSLIAADGACLDTLKLNLPDGDYWIVIMAHSCTGAPTFTSPDKITFPNNKVTDTLYKYISLKVSGSTVQQQDVVLTRAVAALRMTIPEDRPYDVSSFKFYYTGGSSTFDATAGYGCVNSRQTEMRYVSSDNEQNAYTVYTFPHEEEDHIDINITAYDKDGNTINNVKIINWQVVRNVIKTYELSFERSFLITVEDDWDKDWYPLSP